RGWGFGRTAVAVRCEGTRAARDRTAGPATAGASRTTAADATTRGVALAISSTVIEYAGNETLNVRPAGDRETVVGGSAEWPSLVWLWAVSWASPYCHRCATAAGWNPLTWNFPLNAPAGLLLITSRSRCPFASSTA